MHDLNTASGLERLDTGVRPAPAGASDSWWTVPRVLLLALACSIPLRMVGIGGSLWLDEAWVANSILAPTAYDTLYYRYWLQSSPPLWLLLERVITVLGGASEIALRLLPVSYGVAACALAVVTFRRSCRPAGLSVGVALVAGNYWVVKYALQVKQFSGDVLASMIVIALGVQVLRGPSPTRRLSALLLAAATLLPTLSLPSLFWLPTLVLLAGLVVGPDGHVQRAVRAIPAALVAAGALVSGLFTLWFIGSHAEMTAMQTVAWRDGMVSMGRPLATGYALARNLGSLVSPVPVLADTVGALFAATAALAAGCLTLRGLRAPRPDLTIPLLATLPAMTALAASAAGRYPLLDYTRLVVWMLPLLALIAARSTDTIVAWLRPAGQRWVTRASIVGAIIATLALPAALVARPRPQEGGGEAVRHLASSWSADDCVYVHAGMWEQFQYYTREMPRPTCMIWGNTDWPCCAQHTAERATEPTVTTFERDVALARQRAGRRTLWLLLPGGDSGHWSAHLRAALDQAGRLAACGRPVGQRRFGQTQVLRASCASQ